MLDKVIKGLECCKAKNIDHDYDACDRCPYNGRTGGEGCYILYADALTLLKEQDDAFEQMRLDNADLRKCYAELLKEQEPVEPFHKCIGNDFSRIASELIEDAHYDYCPYCGKPITWEGR